MRVRLIAVAVAGGLLAPLARADEPALTVRVRDDASGNALSELQCCLVETTRKEVRARFRGGVYRGSVTPRAGDELWIYHRGYDLRRLRLAAGQREITTTLVPAADRCRVVLRGKPAVPLVVHVMSERPYWPRPVQDDFKAEVGDGGMEFVVPRGVRTFASVSDRQRLIWPKLFNLWPGHVKELTIDPPRLIRVRRDAEETPPRAFEVLPDLMWTPPGPPDRVDAWRLRALKTGWAAFLGDVLALAPDVPVHFFARVAEQPMYRYVRRRDETLDLRPPFPVKTVARRPVVNHAPVSPGTILVPGRVDLYALSRVADRGSSLKGCFHVVAEHGWPRVRLPASDWLTAWNPARGLAHLRWDRDAPTGITYPGELTVVLPAGHTATGHVSAYPDWKGTDDWRHVPHEVLLRRRFEGRRRIRFRGLRPAHYGISIEITMTDEHTGRDVSLDQMRAIDITQEQLKRIYHVSTRPRR